MVEVEGSGSKAMGGRRGEGVASGSVGKRRHGGRTAEVFFGVKKLKQRKSLASHGAWLLATALPDALHLLMIL